MQDNNKPRVRFAPSPTGPLHIGGVRTALYNYLFAKKNNGEFVLRIEDTDQKRFVEGAENYIIEALNWCGIEFDEGVHKNGNYGPYRQSERKDIYEGFARQLIESGWAYYAFDTEEELNNLRQEAESNKRTFTYDVSVRNQLSNSLKLGMQKTTELIDSKTPYVIRFKMPENMDVHMKDIIRGDIKVNTSTLDDKVLFKADGLPTYHLANIVDDYMMKITHVIRGEEWLPSLPLHVLLYKALEWEDKMPEFAHLPLILKPSGKGKLSKRDGDKDGFPVFPIEWKDAEGNTSAGYRESGYEAEALINILALLGWNSGTEQEVFSLKELEQSFDLKKVSKSGARFDPDKAKWFNHQFVQKLNPEKLADSFMEELKEKGVDKDLKFVTKACELVQERLNFRNELWEQTYFFFHAPLEYNPKVVKKRWKSDVPELMNELLEILKNTDDFSSENTEKAVKSWIEENEYGMGKIMNAFRLCLVGDSKGPHLFDITELIGKEETIRRLENGIKNIGE